MNAISVNWRLGVIGFISAFSLGLFAAPYVQVWIFRTKASICGWWRFGFIQKLLVVALVGIVVFLAYFLWKRLRQYARKIRRSRVRWSLPLVLFYGFLGGFLITSIALLFHDTSWLSVCSSLTMPHVLLFGIGLPIALSLPVGYLQLSSKIIKNPVIEANWDFAPGAVGWKDDRLELKTSASRFAERLAKLNGYVSVVGLQGGMGYGKSSYLRIAIEAEDGRGERLLRPEETLYTYLSLTETNKAEDFSKLFAEKWKDTLAERYSTYTLKPLLSALDPLIGSANRGDFFKAIFTKLAEFLDDGPRLFGTKSKVQDDAVVVGESVNQRVADMFFNIPEVVEERWIIVIDELERAPLDELFRLTETVERLKIIGRTGLPVKIIFILCFSREELEHRLSDCIFYPDVNGKSGLVRTEPTRFVSNDSNDEQRRILWDFFFMQKTFTWLEWLPPVSKEKKKEFIMKGLMEALAGMSLTPDMPFEGSPIKIESVGESSSFLAPNDVAVATFLSILIGESTRFQKRIIHHIQNRYEMAYQSMATEVFDPNLIRSGDIFMMEYLKIKYPKVIDFLMDRVEIIDSNPNILNQLHTSFKKQYAQDQADEGRRLEFRNIRICSLNFLSFNNSSNNPSIYHKSLCDPKNLRIYLRNEWPKSEEP